MERGNVEQGVVAETVLAPGLDQDFALPARLADSLARDRERGA